MKIVITVTCCFLLLIGLLLLTSSQEQHFRRASAVDPHAEYPVWLEMMEQPDVDIAEARQAFETYWQHHERYRGDQAKQFERWYALNSSRLDPRGEVIGAAQVAEEFHRLRSQLDVKQEGDWYNYGPIDIAPRNGIKKDAGRVNHMAFHPIDPDILYVSCFQSGLFKTTDGGTSWTPITDNMIDDVFVALVDPVDPETLIIGTDCGVKRSINDGDRWASSSLTEKTRALARKPDERDVLLAGTHTGIHRSSDGGMTFIQVLEAFRVDDLVFHPTMPETVYAGTNDGKFFRSVDGGYIWAENTTDFLGNGAHLKIAVSPITPDYVYVIRTKDNSENDTFEGFYKSTDAGISFVKQSSHLPGITGFDPWGSLSRGQPNYALFVEAHPRVRDLVYAGGVFAWKSLDGGRTWQNFSTNVTSDGGSVHVDQLNWGTSPINDTIYAVNDGGIYRITPEEKMVQLADGLPVAETMWISQSSQAKTGVVGGTIHGGTKQNLDGIWLTPGGGDDALVIFDHTDDSYVYKVTQKNKVRRSTDGGLTYSDISPGNASPGFYKSTAVLQRNDPNTLFVGFEDVYRTNNARATYNVIWANLTQFPEAAKISRIEQGRVDGDVLYVSRAGSFYRSDNVNSYAPMFTDLSPDLPLGGVLINDIETHPTDPDVVYILQGSRIFKSRDRGASWENASGGLPAIALLELVYDISSEEGIYIGTDIGVFYRDAGLADWVDFSKGLPARSVTGMDIYYGSSREDSAITISTFGRGFWRSNLYGVATHAPVAAFTVVSADGSVDAVKFTNESAGGFSYEWRFEGGTPEASRDIHPEVVFDTQGAHVVGLTTTNSVGQDKEIKSCLIQSCSLLPDRICVHCRSPLELMVDLVSLVQSRVTHAGIRTALIAKLETARRLLADLSEDNDHAAVNVLQAFIHQVSAQSGKKIAALDADALIEAAEELVALLGGNDSVGF
jgi:photosystem II stability/assembly factor-like uncharacterized protein